jgi:hypothetical protein
VSEDNTKGGCAIILTGPLNAAKTGDPIAVVQDTGSGCAIRQPTLRLPDTQNGTLKIGVYGLGAGRLTGDPANPCTSSTGLNCSGSVSMFFTPRGMWSSDSFQTSQDMEIRIVHTDAAAPKRCVRVSSILGSIDIGQSSDGDISKTCSSWGRI